MFKKTLLSLVLASVFGIAHAGEDFDLNDLVPATAAPAQTQAVDTSSVKQDGNVVVGKDAKAAVLVAHQSLIQDEEDGIKMIAVGSGIGILSTGSGSYQTYVVPSFIRYLLLASLCAFLPIPLLIFVVFLSLFFVLPFSLGLHRHVLQYSLYCFPFLCLSFFLPSYNYLISSL